MPNKENRLPKIHAIDLFCGIGGLTHGLKLAGIKVKAGFDIDPSCRYAYETNNYGAKFYAADVRRLHFRDLVKHYRGADVTVLAGCAPCQPFSAHNRKTCNPKADDCSLLEEFSRLIHQGNPDFVSMENVSDLIRHEAFKKFLGVLSELKYQCDHAILSCAEYGIPQNRKRLVLLASKLGEIRLPSPTHETTTVREHILKLPAIEAGHTSPDDPAHTTLKLSRVNYDRIRQSKPGGSWRDWEQNIVNECHKKAHYPASYGRMRWDAPAPTITTQFCYYSTGRFGHPEQHRTISVREAAMLQTFPLKYRLAKGKTRLQVRGMARHIGNAVPVKLAQAIGQSIVEASNG